MGSPDYVMVPQWNVVRRVHLWCLAVEPRRRLLRPIVLLLVSGCSAARWCPS